MFSSRLTNFTKIKALMFALLVSNATLAAPIARATFVIGSAQIKAPSGELKPLPQGAELNSGESVITAPRSAVQLLFVDQTRVAIRPSSEIAIDQFNYSAADNSGGGDSMILRLARGALRSVTGLIGTRNKQHFALNTPIATIGIRGTDFEAIHVPDVGGYGGDKSIPPGTYNKVYTGGTSLTTKAGVLDLKINESGFVAFNPKELTVDRPISIAKLPDGIVNIINSAPVPGAALDKPGAPASDATNKASDQNAPPPNSNAEGAPNPGQPPAPPIADAPAASTTPVGDAPAVKNIDPSKLKAIAPAISDLKSSTLSDPSAVQSLKQLAPSQLNALPATTLQTAPLPTTTLQVTPLPTATLQATPLPTTTLSPTTTLQVAPLPTTTLQATPLPTTTLSPTTTLQVAPLPTTTVSPTTTLQVAPLPTTTLQTAPLSTTTLQTAPLTTTTTTLSPTTTTTLKTISPTLITK